MTMYRVEMLEVAEVRPPEEFDVWGGSGTGAGTRALIGGVVANKRFGKATGEAIPAAVVVWGRVVAVASEAAKPLARYTDEQLLAIIEARKA